MQVQWKRACEGFVGIDLGTTCRTWCNSALEAKGPPHSNSDHQDYEPFLIGNPYKPSFTTVTMRGPHPKYTIGLNPDLYLAKHSLVGGPSHEVLRRVPI